MDHWLAFWTALWVGSTRLTRATVDWLCNARPKPAPKAGETGDKTEKTAGEASAKASPKASEKGPAAAEGSALLRWVCTLIAAVVAKATPYTTILATILAALWVLTSLVLGYAAARPAKPAPPTDEKDQGQEEPAAAEEHPRDLLDLGHVAQLLADVYTEGSGVHLATLAEHCSRTPLLGLPPARWETRDVRDLMARHGVRVRDGVRVPPKGGREGVHKKDFPPLPQPSTATNVVGDVVPGQSNNNNDGNTPSPYPFEVVDDPHNPARATVVYPTAQRAK